MHPVFEVAGEADAFRNRDMASLDDLGMARCTPQGLTPTHLGQVWHMVELIFAFEQNLALQQPGFMAALSQAGGVLDLGVRLGPIGFGKGFDQLSAGGDLSSDHVSPAWRKVALGAVDHIVGGGSPTSHIGLYVMAGIAELRRVAVVEEEPAQQPQHSHDQD